MRNHEADLNSYLSVPSVSASTPHPRQRHLVCCSLFSCHSGLRTPAGAACTPRKLLVAADGRPSPLFDGALAFHARARQGRPATARRLSSHRRFRVPAPHPRQRALFERIRFCNTPRPYSALPCGGSSPRPAAASRQDNAEVYCTLNFAIWSQASRPGPPSPLGRRHRPDFCASSSPTALLSYLEFFDATSDSGPPY